MAPRLPILLTTLTILSTSAHGAAPRVDWLIDRAPFKATVTQAADRLTLDNGLVRRVIRLTPDAATVALTNVATDESFLRAVRPEAYIELDGSRYAVGGLAGQQVQNDLDPAALDALQADPAAFHFTKATVGRTAERFPWKPRPQWMPKPLPWPPPGASVTLSFAAPAAVGNVSVDVHYEIYDGLPVISKWITLDNGTAKPVRLTTFTSEVLATVEGESLVDRPSQPRLPNLDVETDYSFGGNDPLSRNSAVHWLADPTYKTQVNYDRTAPCLLEVRPPLGPDQMIAPGERFTSLRTFELAYDSTDRERRGLAVRQMYRAINPWVTENPILMHVRSARPDAVRRAIDQCADVGFEMVILSFGSGFNFESRDPNYQERYKGLADHARSRGIVLGGYSLLSSRSAATRADNVQGVKPMFGVAPCLCSQWGADYLAQLHRFIDGAGLGVLENDGSYPGDACTATTHPFHRGLADSQWAQWRAITGFYQWCRGNGVYLNIPDWYFFNGGSKTGMGYRESNWSLPREQQELIERQNVFDGTWEKTPSMGWMFVPLTEYEGGGAAATIEPLHDHLQHYEHRMADLFGAGVQACYRGPRLYDAPDTEAMVKRMVGFYKRHRAILDSDILHLRRPDAQGLDYFLHVNPTLPERALLMVYNPLPRPLTQDLNVPLYYAGLTRVAHVRHEDGDPRDHDLARDDSITLPVTVPASGYTWFTFGGE